MSVDEDKYLISGILCLCAFVVVSIIFLSTVPFVRKKAIQTEIQRYDFDFSDEPDLEIWDFSTEEIALRFKSYGMYVDDDFYNFDELMITIETSNYCKRVHIVLRFMINPDTYITLPIDKRVLKMIDSFRIRIYNRSQLDYILDNKTIAFEEIYNRGHVSFPPRERCHQVTVKRFMWIQSRRPHHKQKRHPTGCHFCLSRQQCVFLCTFNLSLTSKITLHILLRESEVWL